jgi:hypothetical protein
VRLLAAQLPFFADKRCSCDIPMVGGRFKGFAFVEFEDYRDAKVPMKLPLPLLVLSSISACRMLSTTWIAGDLVGARSRFVPAFCATSCTSSFAAPRNAHLCLRFESSESANFTMPKLPFNSDDIILF